MRSFLLTTVAAAALTFGVAASHAQTSGPMNQQGGGASGGTESPGRSGAAPGQNRVDGGAGGPGRSETAPGQNRVDGGAGGPGRSETAPGQNRSGSASSGERDQQNRQGTATSPGRDQPNRAGSASSTDRDQPNRPGTAASPDRDQQNRAGSASSTDGDKQNRSGTASSPNRDQQNRPGTASSTDRDQQNRTGTATSTDRDQQNRPGTASSTDRDQQNRTGTATSTDRDQQNRTGTASDTSSGSRDTNVTGAISSNTNISTEEKSRITQSFVRRDVQPVTNVDFTVSVGTSIPDRVRLYEVPSDVVRVVPQYRGYNYFVVRDEIVIVEPRTKRIVEVVRRDGGSRASTSTSIRLSGEQRSTFKRVVRERGPSRVTRSVTIREGATLPEDVDLLEVPDTLISELPEVREYRYVVVGDEIALVEPRTRRVIEVIE